MQVRRTTRRDRNRQARWEILRVKGNEGNQPRREGDTGKRKWRGNKRIDGTNDRRGRGLIYYCIEAL